jgi:hypothetical protein
MRHDAILNFVKVFKAFKSIIAEVIMLSSCLFVFVVQNSLLEDSADVRTILLVFAVFI